MDIYEQERILNVYLLFHYGDREEILAGGPDVEFPDEFFRFPVATVTETFDFRGGAGEKRALDLGCAVGRSSFELSKYAGEVIGIDYSTSFIDAAERLRRGELLTYFRYFESHLADELTASVPDGGQSDRISFETGDAMNLRDDLGEFDFVHAANLLCRLSEPLKLLRRLPDLVKPGGQLVMATPCTWLEEFTPRENQPAGNTLDFLKGELGEAFDFVRVQEVPFLIREHARKLQVSTSQTSAWVRK